MTQIDASAPARAVVRLAAIGTVVDVVTTGPRAHEAAAAVATAWDACVVGPTAPATAVLEVLVADPALHPDEVSRGVLVAATVDEMLHHLSQVVTFEALGRRAGSLLMLHACGVADPRTGHTLVAVAASGTGKTTVARTLGRGRVYLSDETVALDDRHHVLPYPKPLSVRGADGRLKAQVPSGGLGLLPPSAGPYAPAALWVLDRRPEPVEEARLEPLGLLDTVMALTPQASFLPELDRPLQRLEQLWHEVGGARRAVYHEAADLEPLLVDALGSRP